MSTEQGSGNGEEPPVIRERISTRVIEALINNYTDPQQAILELVDNAVDDRIKELGAPQLIVRVRVYKDEISVANEGGMGLGLTGLHDFFAWGESEKVDSIGSFGIGGKAAMGFLGRSMEVVCSAKDSEVEYRVVDENWESRPGGELKEFPERKSKAIKIEGYFRVRVTNLKREVNPRTLSSKLGDIYRPLLIDGSVKIGVNGVAVKPLDIKYREDDLSLQPTQYRLQTRLGDHILLKVGILEEGQSVKPGIRCYYNGRLVEDEQFFGLPTPVQMPQMSRFTGEAHLDFAKVTSNKTKFIKSHPTWDTASRRIHDQLERDWRDKIAGLRMEQKSPVDKRDQELAQRAKRLIEDVFATTMLVTKNDLAGESGGRLPPNPARGTIKFRSEAGSGSTTREGKTAPRLEATVAEETVKRWGALHKWEVISMGIIDRRGEIIEENGKLILKINSDYPLFQAAKRIGDYAQEMYLAETAAMIIIQKKTEGQTIEEYLDLFNRAVSELGARLYRRIPRKQ